MGEGASFVLQKKSAPEPAGHDTASTVAEESVTVPLLSDGEVRACAVRAALQHQYSPSSLNKRGWMISFEASVPSDHQHYEAGSTELAPP